MLALGKKIACLALFSSFVAGAALPNFQFSAEDNNQPVFVEKCKIWLTALEQGDMTLLTSFFDPKIAEQHPQAVASKLESMISRQQRINAKPGFVSRKVALSEPGVTLEHIANVNVDYTFEKGHTGISCGFERTASGNWQLIP